VVGRSRGAGIFFGVVPDKRVDIIHNWLGSNGNEGPWGPRCLYPYLTWPTVTDPPGNFANGGIYPWLAAIDSTNRFIRGNASMGQHIFDIVTQTMLYRPDNPPTTPFEWMQGDTGAWAQLRGARCAATLRPLQARMRLPRVGPLAEYCATRHAPRRLLHVVVTLRLCRAYRPGPAAGVDGGNSPQGWDAAMYLRGVLGAYGWRREAAVEAAPLRNDVRMAAARSSSGGIGLPGDLIPVNDAALPALHTYHVTIPDAGLPPAGVLLPITPARAYLHIRSCNASASPAPPSEARAAAPCLQVVAHARPLAASDGSSLLHGHAWATSLPCALLPSSDLTYRCDLPAATPAHVAPLDNASPQAAAAAVNHAPPAAAAAILVHVHGVPHAQPGGSAVVSS
jgi:hypothetical protein